MTLWEKRKLRKQVVKYFQSHCGLTKRQTRKKLLFTEEYPFVSYQCYFTIHNAKMLLSYCGYWNLYRFAKSQLVPCNKGTTLEKCCDYLFEREVNDNANECL